MSDFTTFLSNEMLDHVFLGNAYTAPADVYVALAASGPTELTGNGYARQTITFGTPAASGAIANTATITFTASGGDWSEATHFAIFDALTTGNQLTEWVTLTTARTITDGNSGEFAVGDLDVTLT